MPQEPTELFVSRWGDAELDDYGYAHIPGFILRNCAEAGVDPVELAFITQAISFKYDLPNSESRASMQTLAERLGRDIRTARRYKSSLVKKGLCEVEDRYDENGRTQDVITFRGLVAKCRHLEQTRTELSATPRTKMSGTPRTELSGHEESEDSQESEDSTSLAAAAAAAPKNDEPDSFECDPDIQQQVLDEEIAAIMEPEPPKRRKTKRANGPPKKVKTNTKRNWRFEVVAFYGHDRPYGGPYSDEISARIGKALKHVDDELGYPISREDLLNAFEHFKRKSPNAHPPNDGVKIVSMIYAWVADGKLDYVARAMQKKEERPWYYGPDRPDLLPIHMRPAEVPS